MAQFNGKYTYALYKPGVGNLFTVMSHMNCALLWAGRKIN